MRRTSRFVCASRFLSRGGPLLVGGAGAAPNLQPGAVRRAVSGGVQALVRVDVDEVVRRRRGPLLGTGSVAVPQLRHRAVGGAGSTHVQALAQRPDRAVGADGPLLRTGSVAVPQL